MKRFFYLFLLLSCYSSLYSQIETPLLNNTTLQKLFQQENPDIPKGWNDSANLRQRACDLEQEGVVYIDAGRTYRQVVEIDTMGLDTFPGVYNCINCDANPIGTASMVNDTFVLVASNSLIAQTFTFIIEYCTDLGCNETRLNVVGRRPGQNYFPPAVTLASEESTQLISQASFLPGPLTCNKIVDVADDYEGRSQLSYFTSYAGVDSTIIYQADRHAGLDSLYVILCDTFAICDTFHYALIVQHDTIKIGGSGLDYFMDDFSYGGVITDADYWLDKDPFVNRTYAVAPPSVGVATFDGLRSDGTPWLGGFGLADRLTSTYFDLTDESGVLYLSYWLQAGGIGLIPDETEVFTLEFKDAAGEWQMIATYNATDTLDGGIVLSNGFDFASHEITSEYKHDAFQFRFTSYNDRKGINSIWNLDYVRINDEANLPLENDIAFTLPPAGILDIYRAMPWRHFQGREDELTRPTLDVGIFNFDDITLNAGDTELSLVEEVTGTTVYENIGILNDQTVNIPAGASFLELPIESYTTQQNVLKSGVFNGEEELSFRMLYRLVSPPNQNVNLGQGRDGILLNDTVSQVNVFSDYFAYDDGSAERGVFVQEDDQVAVKFTSIVDDTLQAVQLHFPHFISDVSDQTFNLKVWVGELDDEPEYVLNFVNPFYPDSAYDTLQGYTTYPLVNTEGGSTPLEIPAGDFYIGWQQQSDCFFNDCITIGYDRNTPQAFSTLFFKNNENTWEPFPENFRPGALMIRAVVGSEIASPTGTEELDQPVSELVVYPNPTSGAVRVQLLDTDYSVYQLLVYNNMGQLVHQGVLKPEMQLNHLENGMYFLRAVHQNTGQEYQTRIVITK
jgi:hypothetical protein